MHYSSHNRNRPNCPCCGTAISGRRLILSSEEHHTTSRNILRRRRPRPTSKRATTSSRHRVPLVWTTALLALATIMLRAQAFSVPKAWKVSRLSRSVSLPKYHQYNAITTIPPHRGRTSSLVVAAINSRELRFYSQGPSSSSSSSSTGPSSRNSQQHSSSSIPEVLAASMSNYFFGNHAHHNLMAFAAAATSEHRQTQTQSRGNEQQQAYISTVASSATAVLSAPSSLLQSQQTFRASRSSSSSNSFSDGNHRRNSGDHADHDEEEEKLLEPLKGLNQEETVENLIQKKEEPVNGAAAAGATSTSRQYPPPKQGYGYSIELTDEEKALFSLLRQVHQETQMTTTLRVAGGWVRDKLLATPEFQIFHRYHNAGGRLTSKFKKGPMAAMNPEQPSMGRQGTKLLRQDDNGPVDIDIALDTMLGREFADHLNEYLQNHGRDTVSVGVVLKNPEKSKHLETATMKVGSFWIDFVNLRAEEYTHDSRIPDLMRIGTASEDAFRRDLTINSLFFNINTGQVEDWTGRGFADLRRGIVATPLAPLTTLLDDPLRVLRSIRFAARLRFGMDEELVEAAKEDNVRLALAQKVSRERVGGEVDLMLRSPDPVGAMRLLINLNLVETVFPVDPCLPPHEGVRPMRPLFDHCLHVLSTTHDHLYDCKITPPVWCQKKRMKTVHDVAELPLTEDEEARRLLWYAAFLKPVRDYAQRLKQPQVTKRSGKKANRSVLSKLLVDELKRPGRDTEQIEKIMKAADDITLLIKNGCDLSATLILLSDVTVREGGDGGLKCSMRSRAIDSATEEDPVWEHAMEFRLLCSQVLLKVGSLWRAALMLSLSEQLASLTEEDDLEYTIEGDIIDDSREEQRLGIIEQYDTFATAMQQMGMIGIWNAKPLLDGKEVKEVLPHIPQGPAFREVMEEQELWMTTHPGAGKEPLIDYIRGRFSDYTKPREKESKRKR